MATVFLSPNERQRAFAVDGDPEPAGLPTRNPTRSFWTDSSPGANPLARQGSTGPLTTDADVCIIGSGITGVGVAYHLSESIQTHARSPLKVVVLEARDFCSGATGRNGGHLTPATYAGFDARMTAYGPEEAMRSYALEAYTVGSLAQIIHERGWTHDVDLVRGGHVRLLTTDREVEATTRDREAAARAGWVLEGVRDLSLEEVRATLGARHPAIVSDGYNLWPLKLVTALYRHAASRASIDLSLHTHTPVTGIRRVDAGRAYALSTPRGTIACSRVVHATNAYASHLLPILTGPHGIVPVRGQVLATRARVGSDQIDRHGWAANMGSEYWFARPVEVIDEKPLVVLGGARDAARPAMEVYVDDDSACHSEVGEALRAFLPETFEGKFEPGQEPEMEWTGIMGHTEMGDPFVGPVDKLADAQGTDGAQYAGQFIAAGYSGHGMPRAFACAEVIAQMILAELAGTEWKQPEWLPTRYLTWVPRGNSTSN